MCTNNNTTAVKLEKINANYRLIANCKKALAKYAPVYARLAVHKSEHELYRMKTNGYLSVKDFRLVNFVKNLVENLRQAKKDITTSLACPSKAFPDNAKFALLLEQDCQCPICGERIHTTDSTEMGGHLLCSACALLHTVCADCGELLAKEESYFTYSNDTICESCYLDGYFTCRECGDIFPQDDAYYSEHYEEYFCETCFRHSHAQCDCCGDYAPNDRVLETYDNGVVCQDCYDNQYCMCDDCELAVHADHTHRIGGYTYCPNCANDHKNSDIHSYSYKPTPTFFRNPTDKVGKSLYFGIELELSHCGDLDDRDTNADYCLSILNSGGENVYLKEDSSLDAGFEIVSHPRTLASWQAFKPSIENYFEKASDYSDGRRDGLHVHISKKGMTDCHKIRFGTFFAMCKENIIPIARRESTWSTYRDKPKNAAEAKELSSNLSRYEAVNWKNSATVEVRIFRATLDCGTFFACLQFCHAAYQFTKQCSLQTILNSQAWAAFLTFVANDSRYKDLKKYLMREYSQGDNANIDNLILLTGKKVG